MFFPCIAKYVFKKCQKCQSVMNSSQNRLKQAKKGLPEGINSYKSYFHDTSDTSDTFKRNYMQRA